jgi:type VI protein secretion system component Hcp
MAWFLKIEGTKGESLEQPQYMNVLSWNFGANLSVAHSGTSAGQVAGQAEVHDLTTTIMPDKAFVDLMKFICSGKPLKSAELLGTKDVGGGGKAKEFFKLTMDEVYVSSAHLSGTGAHGSDAFDPHTISLKFNKMKIEYAEYKKDGSAGDKPKMSFDAGKHVTE